MDKAMPGPHRGNRRRAEADARLDRIRTATAALLSRRGYEATSLSAVLRLSGGSKATIVKYFGGKQGLVLAVMAGEAEQCARRAMAGAAGRPPAVALRNFAEAVLAFLASPSGQAGYRAIIAGGPSSRSFVRGYFERGEGRLVAALAGLLRGWSRDGALHSADPEGDARKFLFMLRSGPVERALLGAQREVSARERRAQARACTRLLLNGLRPSQSR